MTFLSSIKSVLSIPHVLTGNEDWNQVEGLEVDQLPFNRLASRFILDICNLNYLYVN